MGRSRRTGMMRSMQSRMATGWPSFAISTALFKIASASPSRICSRACVARLRAPLGRPAGSPDWPPANGFPSPRIVSTRDQAGCKDQPGNSQVGRSVKIYTTGYEVSRQPGPHCMTRRHPLVSHCACRWPLLLSRAQTKRPLHVVHSTVPLSAGSAALARDHDAQLGVGGRLDGSSHHVFPQDWGASNGTRISPVCSILAIEAACSLAVSSGIYSLRISFDRVCGE